MPTHARRVADCKFLDDCTKNICAPTTGQSLWAEVVATEVVGTITVTIRALKRQKEASVTPISVTAAVNEPIGLPMEKLASVK